MFFIICLLTSSFLTCVCICVSASLMLAEGAGDVPLKGVWIAGLVLGWRFSKKFSNNSLLFVVPVCCGFVPVVVPGSGGGVTVGWYPVGMWLPVGLGVLLWNFLQALMSWFGPLQCVQKTLFTAFDSHVALFSTSGACRTVSVVRSVQRVIVKTTVTGVSGHTCLLVCACGCICPFVVSLQFIATCYTGCASRELTSWCGVCSLEY